MKQSYKDVKKLKYMRLLSIPAAVFMAFFTMQFIDTNAAIILGVFAGAALFFILERGRRNVLKEIMLGTTQEAVEEIGSVEDMLVEFIKLGPAFILRVYLINPAISVSLYEAAIASKFAKKGMDTVVVAIQCASMQNISEYTQTKKEFDDELFEDFKKLGDEDEPKH